VIHSLPAFVAQGEFSTTATVADVVEVECNPTLYGTGSKIKITASQLFSLCRGNLTWYVPNPYRTESGRGVSVELDADGNATVALRGGPLCSAGESLITAHMEEEPFESFTASFTVLPPVPTVPGVYTMPSVQVEDAGSSGVATIVQAEFGGGSEKPVRIGSEELYHRCRVAPHLHWILMDGTNVEDVPEVNAVQLDNDGNAFVIAIGDASCAPGRSLVEADLETKPFTTYTTEFEILPPQPTGEPAFTIEKLQEIAGSGSGFTKSPLTGVIGQTVEYEIVVRNTGVPALTLSNFTDQHCDPGTIAGGPGEAPLAPGEATTYTCTHLLTSAGIYTNEATVTGTAPGEAPLTQTSNQVVVEVTTSLFTIEKLQRIAESEAGYTTAPLTGAIGQTIEYEIVVKNTGLAALTLSNFTDPLCDPGTIGGGRGEVPLAPGEATTYTCTHLITSAGTYINVATVTGTAPGQAPRPLASNAVIVEVPAAKRPLAPSGGSSPSGSAGSGGAGGGGGGGGVLNCKAKSLALHGASGPKRGTFTVQVPATGIKRITFYLDGRKLRTLTAAQARGGKFTIKLNPSSLSFGPHKVSIRALTSCASVARSGVFVHARATRVVPPFTG